MKEQKIGEIKSHLFEDNLIISLDKKWIEKFQGIPTFTVLIDKQNRLCLKSQVIRSGDK